MVKNIFIDFLSAVFFGKPYISRILTNMAYQKQRFYQKCGLDEAGRGAWAGPLVAAAVVLKCSVAKISRLAQTKIKDGKLLRPQQRQKIYQALKQAKAELVVEAISVRSINNHGIGWANREIFRRLIRKVVADEYIVDGNLKIGRINSKTQRIKSIVDADATIPEVILAGIVAKVERDKIMRHLHSQFPGYKWFNNKGYGTKQHLRAIENSSDTYHHRHVFVATALRHHSKNYFY